MREGKLDPSLVHADGAPKYKRASYSVRSKNGYTVILRVKNIFFGRWVFFLVIIQRRYFSCFAQICIACVEIL